MAQLIPRTRNTLHSLGRHPGLHQNLHQLQRRKRRIRRRLHNHRIARSQCRTHLVTHQIQGKIKRRNRQHHPTRHAQRKTKLIAHPRAAIQRNGLAVQPLGLLCRQRHRLNRPTSLADTLGQNLAFFQRNRTPQILNPFLHQIHSTMQNLIPLISCQSRHCLGTAHGRRNRHLRICGIAFWHRIHHRIVKWIDHIDLLGFIHPLTTNMHLHGKPPSIS